MGTRSVVNVVDESGDTILRLYRMYDGYPSAAGLEVAQFLANKRIVNGYGNGDPVREFNGAGDLAARLVTFLKNQNNKDFDLDKGEFVGVPGHDHPGNFYIQAVKPDADTFSDVQFVYTVRCEYDTDEATIEFLDKGDNTTDTAPASVFADKWADGSHD